MDSFPDPSILPSSFSLLSLSCLPLPHAFPIHFVAPGCVLVLVNTPTCLPACCLQKHIPLRTTTARYLILLLRYLQIYYPPWLRLSTRLVGWVKTPTTPAVAYLPPQPCSHYLWRFRLGTAVPLPYYYILLPPHIHPSLCAWFRCPSVFFYHLPPFFYHLPTVLIGSGWLGFGVCVLRGRLLPVRDYTVVDDFTYTATHIIYSG